MQRRDRRPPHSGPAPRTAAPGLARLILAVAAFGIIACEDGRQASVDSEESVQAIQVGPGTAAIGDAYGTGSGTPGRGVAGGVASGGGPQRAAVRTGRPGSRTEAAPAPPPPPMGAPMPVTFQDRPSQTSANPSEPGAATVPSMLIRTGNAVIEVDSLEIAISEVRLLAQRMGGWIANTSMQTGQGQIRSATLEVKIPAARYDEAVAGLPPLGKVEAVNEHSEDVGEEYVDLTARMTNAKRLEERLITLLATRTGRLEDVLAVERELARVREEIERYQGRMRYLSTRAAISTLSVTVHEPRPLVGNNPGRSVIGDAFRDAWRNFVWFIAGLIEAMGVLIPLALLALVAWLLWRRFGPPLPRRNRPSDLP